MKPVPLLAALVALFLAAMIAFLLMPSGGTGGGQEPAIPGGGGPALTVTPEGLEAPERIAENMLVPLDPGAGGPARSADAVVDPGPWLEVVDPQGRPIPGAEIYWADPFEELSSGKGLFENTTITGAAGMDQLLLDRGERATADETGRWRLPEFSRAVHVHARFEGATALTTLRAEELQEVQRLVLKSTARFEIHFVNAAGEPEPVPQLVVDVRKRDGDAWRTSRSLSAFGSEGRFVLPLPALLNARSTADLGLAHPPGLFRPPGGYGFEIASPPTEPVEWVVPPKALMVLRLEERTAPGWRGLKAVRAEVDFEALGLLPNQPRPVPRVAPISEIEASTRESAGPGDGDWLVFLGDVEVQTPLKITLEFKSGAVLGPLSVSGPPVANQTHVIAIAPPDGAAEVGVRFKMLDLAGSTMDRAQLHLTLLDAEDRRMPKPQLVGEGSDEDGIARIETPWIFASCWPESWRDSLWPTPFTLQVQAEWGSQRWVTEEPLVIDGAPKPASIDLGEVRFVPAQAWLEGVVLDSDGQPVANAEVVVRPVRADTTDSLRLDPSDWLPVSLQREGVDMHTDVHLTEYTTRSNGSGLFRLWGAPVTGDFALRAEVRHSLTASGGRQWTDKHEVEQTFRTVPQETVELRFAPRFVAHGRLTGDPLRLSRVKLGVVTQSSPDSAPGEHDFFDSFLAINDRLQYDAATGEWCLWTSRTQPLRVRGGVLGELGELFSTDVLEPVDNADSGGLDLGAGQLQPPAQAPTPPGEDG